MMDIVIALAVVIVGAITAYLTSDANVYVFWGAVVAIGVSLLYLVVRSGGDVDSTVDWFDDFDD